MVTTACHVVVSCKCLLCAIVVSCLFVCSLCLFFNLKMKINHPHHPPASTSAAAPPTQLKTSSIIMSAEYSTCGSSQECSSSFIRRQLCVSRRWTVADPHSLDQPLRFLSDRVCEEWSAPSCFLFNTVSLHCGKGDQLQSGATVNTQKVRRGTFNHPAGRHHQFMVPRATEAQRGGQDSERNSRC